MFDIGFLNTKEIKCEAKRHHYSMFNVGRSMFSLFHVYANLCKEGSFNHIYKECQSLSKMLPRRIQARLKSIKEKE